MMNFDMESMKTKAKHNPQYTGLLMDEVEGEKDAWYIINDVFMSQKHPEPKFLERFLKYDRPNGDDMNILKSKYEAALIVPSVMEKTMTDYQLFRAGNELWKQNLTGYGILCIEYAKKLLENRHELTEEDFNYIKHLGKHWKVSEYLTKYGK